MLLNEPYDADYYLRGRQTGKSLYENYRWLPKLTLPMARAMLRHLRTGTTETFLDFGCARGYLVKSLRMLGHQAWGVDGSRWAVENADPSAKEFVSSGPLREVDWVIAKDVLEHVTDLRAAVDDLLKHARKGLFVVVPLAENGRYVVPEYELDVTHLHRTSLQGWAAAFMHPSWSVEAAYRVPGIKDNYAQYARGNGFLTVRRLPG